MKKAVTAMSKDTLEKDLSMDNSYTMLWKKEAGI